MKWTSEKLEALRSRYPHEETASLAAAFGCTPKALAYQAHLLGVKKTEKANEARYASSSKKERPVTKGASRAIATGIVIVSGGVLTHVSYSGVGA